MYALHVLIYCNNSAPDLYSASPPVQRQILAQCKPATGKEFISCITLTFLIQVIFPQVSFFFTIVFVINVMEVNLVIHQARIMTV